MVTKKTRLMSAFAAVLMLISLFSAFALPVVAAVELAENPPVEWPAGWPETMIAYKDRTPSSTATDYAITDAEDWIAAATDSNSSSDTERAAAYQTFDGITLWLTNDIDFSEETLSGTTPIGYFFNNRKNKGNFKGTINGQGYSITNMDVDLYWTETNGNKAYLGLICYGNGATIRDLTVDATCSFKYDTALYTNAGKTSSAECQNGVFMGCGTGCTFINCRNEADIEYTNSGNPKSDTSVSVFGRQQGAPVLINCHNLGNVTNNDNGRATGLAEWVTAVAGTTFYNCFNTGTLTTAYTGTDDFTGMISSQVKTGTSIDEIVIVNSYNIGDSFASGGRNYDVLNAKGNELEAGAETTGELAYLLNKNREEAYDYEYGAVYYTMQDGEIAYGTEQNQTVKVQFMLNEELYSEGYADLNEAVDVTTLCDIPEATYASDSATVSEGMLTVTAAPADQTVVVNVTTTAQVVADTTPLTNWIAAFNAAGKNTAYYTVDGTETGETLATAFERVQANIAANYYVYSSEVEEEVAKLESYKMIKVVSIDEWEVYKDEAPGYDGIDSVADLEKIANIVKNDEIVFTADQTLYITGDIAFEEGYTGAAINLGKLAAAIDGSKAEGGVATISNLYTPVCWIGAQTSATSYFYSYVPALKNLTFYNCHSTATSTADYSNTGLILGYIYVACDIENVTLDGCSADLSARGASVAGGLLVGRASANPLNLKNITVKNCTLARGDYDGLVTTSSYVNSGFVLGKGSAGTELTVDGLYMINNEITGQRLGSAAGIAFGEIVGPVTVKNVGIFNTTVETTTRDLLGNETELSNVKGVLFGLIKNADVTRVVVENVITANNKAFHAVPTPEVPAPEATEIAVPLICNQSTISGVEIKNVYTDAAAIRTTEVENEVIDATAIADAAAAIASGEAVYELNKVADQKWVMTAEGVPAFGEAILPFKITFSAIDSENPENSINEVRYTDKNGKVIIDDELLFAANWEGEDLTQRVFTEDTVVNGALIVEHTHEWIYTYDADADTHTAVCGYDNGSCPAVIETTACEFTATAPANTVAPADAKHTMTCVCGNSYEEVCTISTVTTPATCLVPGSTVSSCAVCGYTNTELLTREHDWAYTHVEGTTGDASKHLCDCKWEDCDAQEEVACTFGAWDVVGATKDQEGSKTRVCSVCGYHDVIVLPKLASLDLEAEMGVRGQNVEVKVNLVNNPGVAGMTVEFAYDSDVFTLVGVEAGDLEADQFISAIKPDGTVTNKVTFANVGNITADGTIATLTFKVSNTAAAADYQIALTNTAVDFDGKKVQVENFTGTVTVVDFIRGDIDGDGFATMTDAVLLLRYVSGLPVNLTVNEQAADLIAEGDDTLGEVNINDVVYLLEYLNGWYETL